MAPSSHHPSWPPQSEPVTPAAVVARLDELGWSPGTYKLVEHTRNHALVSYKSVYPDRFVLLDLRDGHQVASYYDLGSGRDIVRRLREREQEDDQ